MRVAMITAQPGSAIDNVIQPVAQSLRELGVEVDVLPFDVELSDPDIYELIHFGFFNMPMIRGLEDWEGPRTANVWHVSLQSASQYFAILAKHNFDGLVVDDTTTYQLVGQMGFTPTIVPMVTDLSKFKPLPVPEGVFTVGYFGSDFPHKRYETIRLAAEKAGVQCLLFVTDRARACFEMDPITDVYAHLHVLIHASYVDTNSQPVLEALRCGRPVIATYAPRLASLLQFGGGLLTDGSVDDIARCIKQIKANYAMFAFDAAHDQALADEVQSQTLMSAAVGYKRLFERVIASKA